MKCRKGMDRIKARNPKNNETMMLVKVKNAISMKRVESQLDVLKGCECNFLMRYIDAVKKDGELWVIVVEEADGIGCNGVWGLYVRRYTHEAKELLDRGCIARNREWMFIGIRISS